nr:hypothetical protein [Thermoguttaceae bacterium]
MQYGIFLLTLLSLGAFGGVQEGKKATNELQKLMEDGKYVKVLEAVDLTLFGDEKDAPAMNPKWIEEETAENLPMVLRFRIMALENLNRSSEIDDFMEKFTSVYGESWRALQAAALVWGNVNHHGRVVAGKFYRGNQQRNGEFASVFERDRIRALQLMTQAAEKVQKEVDPIARGWFYIDFAEFILSGRGGNCTSWELQDLTDLKNLPEADTENPWSEGRRASQVEGTPVNEDGSPLIFSVPESYEVAKSDGERWRWALAESGKCKSPQDEKIAKLFRDEATYRLAVFYQKQYGEQTLAQIWNRFSSATGDETQEEMTRESSLLQLETLSDSETIARTATGIRRFTMPDGANYIQLFKELASKPGRFQRDIPGRPFIGQKFPFIIIDQTRNVIQRIELVKIRVHFSLRNRTSGRLVTNRFFQGRFEFFQIQTNGREGSLFRISEPHAKHWIFGGLLTQRLKTRPVAGDRFRPVAEIHPFVRFGVKFGRKLRKRRRVHLFEKLDGVRVLPTVRRAHSQMLPRQPLESAGF